MTVKNKLIKNLAHKIRNEYSERISSSFERNKKLMEKLTTVSNKKIRNQVAGVLTRKYNMRCKND